MSGDSLEDDFATDELPVEEEEVELEPAVEIEAEVEGHAVVGTKRTADDEPKKKRKKCKVSNHTSLFN